MHGQIKFSEIETRRSDSLQELYVRNNRGWEYGIMFRQSLTIEDENRDTSLDSFICDTIRVFSLLRGILVLDTGATFGNTKIKII